jgi:hypothetical protein
MLPQDDVDMLPYDLFRLVAENPLGIFIEEANRPIAGPPDDDAVCVLDEFSVPLFALSKSLLSSLPFGHINCGPDDGGPALVYGQCAQDIYIDDAAILTQSLERIVKALHLT